MRRVYTPYWDRYWAKQRKPVRCGVCEDTGFVSAAESNLDRNMNVMPCPMKCEATKTLRRMKI